MFKNCVLYLIGFQGVGKLSIAREICQQADFRLIDNHAINNLVFPFVRIDGKTKFTNEIWDPIIKIRDIVLDTMARIGNREFNFVFTNVLYEGLLGDLKAYNSLEQAVQKREGCFIPVRVLCEENEHRRRIANPEREINMKDTNHAKVAELHQEYETFKPVHPHTIMIDVTHLSAVDAASAILKQAKDIFAASETSERTLLG